MPKLGCSAQAQPLQRHPRLWSPSTTSPSVVTRYSSLIPSALFYCQVQWVKIRAQNHRNPTVLHQIRSVAGQHTVTVTPPGDESASCQSDGYPIKLTNVGSLEVSDLMNISSHKNTSCHPAYILPPWCTDVGTPPSFPLGMEEPMACQENISLEHRPLSTAQQGSRSSLFFAQKHIPIETVIHHRWLREGELIIFASAELRNCLPQRFKCR